MKTTPLSKTEHHDKHFHAFPFRAFPQEKSIGNGWGCYELHPLFLPFPHCLERMGMDGNEWEWMGFVNYFHSTIKDEFLATPRSQEMNTKRPYCCGNCPSYYDQSMRTDIDNCFRRGQCRTNPPPVNSHDKWPQVYYLDFCGSHPSAPLSRTEQLLAQIASRLEAPEDRAMKTMRLPPETYPLGGQSSPFSRPVR